jgi:hypothetical protein
MGRQNLETRLVESLLVVCLSVFAISNGCSKDSCCAHKGLVTNWPHHNTLPWRFMTNQRIFELPPRNFSQGRAKPASYCINVEIVLCNTLRRRVIPYEVDILGIRLDVIYRPIS